MCDAEKEIAEYCRCQARLLEYTQITGHRKREDIEEIRCKKCWEWTELEYVKLHKRCKLCQRRFKGLENFRE